LSDSKLLDKIHYWILPRETSPARNSILFIEVIFS